MATDLPHDFEWSHQVERFLRDVLLGFGELKIRNLVGLIAFLDIAF